jgi:hypothetical protein
LITVGTTGVGILGLMVALAGVETLVGAGTALVGAVVLAGAEVLAGMHGVLLDFLATIFMVIIFMQEIGLANSVTGLLLTTLDEEIMLLLEETL